MGALILFPERVAIGRVQPDGSVVMSREFSRALADLLARVGGANGPGTNDLATEAASGTTLAQALQLAQTVAALQHEIAGLTGQLAALQQTARSVADLAVDNVTVPAPTDWEHPGQLGQRTPNSAIVTSLEARGKVKLSPAAKDVEIKPTGVALVTIQPEQPGQLDNMELGKTTPRAARVLTLNKLTFTQPATAATYTLADGKTFSVGNSLTLTGTDGATLNIGGGGTLGSAAYASSGAFAGRTSAALGGAATDPASTQTLANNIRNALLAVGIGS